MKVKSVIAVGLVLTSFSAFAKEISLYDQPNNNAKVVGTVDPATGIVPIFSPKPGDWIKIGDPRNGNVGWIKSTELKSISGSVSYTQKIINNGNGPQVYQVVQYGKAEPLTAEQMRNLQLQQQTFQRSVQKMMNEMMSDMNNFPWVMPMIVVEPEKKK